MTNTSLNGLVSQTQISAKVCEAWFGRVKGLLNEQTKFHKLLTKL